MGNTDKKGICIYCCGSAGKVGWVSSCQLRHEEGTPIVKLTLSLWHRDAIIFTDDYSIDKVLQFLDGSSAYEDYHVFNW